MRCPNCTTAAECIDSRQLEEHRYRRYRCPSCQTRFSTGEFIVAIGNRTGGHPVQKWLAKLRGQGAAQLIEKLDALLTPWRNHGPIKDESTPPEGIQADAVANPRKRVALAGEGSQRPDDRCIE